MWLPSMGRPQLHRLTAQGVLPYFLWTCARLILLVSPKTLPAHPCLHQTLNPPLSPFLYTSSFYLGNPFLFPQILALGIALEQGFVVNTSRFLFLQFVITSMKRSWIIIVIITTTYPEKIHLCLKRQLFPDLSLVRIANLCLLWKIRILVFGAINLIQHLHKVPAVYKALYWGHSYSLSP